MVTDMMEEYFEDIVDTEFTAELENRLDTIEEGSEDWKQIIRSFYPGFKEALDELRFSYAQKLLVFTELSVKEIQFRSGFYDYANFARRFRQKYGITPTQYRKAHTFRPPKN